MKILKENYNGNPYITITDDEYEYTFLYYSTNKWVDESKIVLVKGKNDADKVPFHDSYLSDIVLVDIENETEELLVKGAFRCIVHENQLYYVLPEGLYHMDISTKETELLYSDDNIIFPHITADGRYINWQANPDKDCKKYHCFIFDTETKECFKAFEKSFEAPHPEADHMMLCPTDPDKIFFAHEGCTFYISNRLWLWDKEKGMHCMAKQRLTDDGDLGDCFGHECWAADGKGLYFVKYPCSPTPPTGICYVDTDFKQTDVLYGKYRYWHVCASPNGRYLASDTFAVNVPEAPDTEVCIIDMKTGKEQCVAIAGTTWNHPAHPHPCFSPETTRLCFNNYKSGKVCVSIMNIEDIKWD